MDLSKIEPFEVCSIRPPTENYSLTFRLTRNCGWNKCLFCPVYKQKAAFSRRSIEEIKKDVDRAKALDDLMKERGIGGTIPAKQRVERAQALITEIDSARGPGKTSPRPESPNAVTTSAGWEEPCASAASEEDERSSWFSSWFKQMPTIEDSVYHLLGWRLHGQNSCFLGDANSLLLKAGFFAEAVGYVRKAFPDLSRFTIYGRTRSAAKKSPLELKEFREAGLDRIHFGLESGNDTVLTLMRKGVTAAEHIEGCAKTRDAGISCSVYVMPGLGGAALSEEHARETARVLTACKPDFIRIRSLEIFPGTGLDALLKKGEFAEASEEQMVREIRVLVEGVRTETTMVSDSASNLLDVSGRLPGDRPRMLAVIDRYLSLDPREKLVFSLSSRLQSFMGQYGAVTQDIMAALAPYLDEDGIGADRMTDKELTKTIRLIRAKLMP
jgi:hypothetical protein